MSDAPISDRPGLAVNHTSYDQSRTLRLTGVVGLSLLLTFCVIAWLHALQVAGLAVTGGWALNASRVAGDASLVFAPALLAIAAAAWLADRSRTSGFAFTGLLAAAAWIAGVFAILLVPVLGLHHVLARVLDGGQAHSFHGLAPVSKAGASGRVLWNLLEGLHDALFIYIAAVPIMWLSLTVLVASTRGYGVTQAPRARVRRALPRAIVRGLIVLCLLATAAVGVSLALAQDPYLHPGAHAALTASVPVGVEAKIDGVRVAVRSAEWLRQPRATRRAGATPVGESSPPALPDRVYLDVRLKNVGNAPRRIGRHDFRMRGPNGSWGPLAEDFPDFVLAPQERLRTRLIFEVTQQPVELEFAWAQGAPKVRIPLADDAPAGFFQTICRGLGASSNWD